MFSVLCCSIYFAVLCTVMFCFLYFVVMSCTFSNPSTVLFWLIRCVLDCCTVKGSHDKLGNDPEIPGKVTGYLIQGCWDGLFMNYVIIRGLFLPLKQYKHPPYLRYFWQVLEMFNIQC